MRTLHIARSPRFLRLFIVPVVRRQTRLGDYVAMSCADIEGMDELRRTGFDVFDNGIARRLTPWNLLGGVLRLRRIITEHGFDAVVVHTPIASVLGRLAARLAGVKRIVYFCHGLPCAPLQSRYLWHLWFSVERFLARWTDAIVVMNDYDEELARRRHLVKKPDGRIFRVPGMGVDLSKFVTGCDEQIRAGVVAEFGPTEPDKIVICIARLISLKGVHEYVQAACRAARDRPRTLFLLAGEGPEEQALARRVARLGAQANVKVLGWRADVERLMRASDIFVLPTYFFEGLPVSILEAMACGKPVIASTQRGCRDAVVHGETGLLVPPKDVETLTQRIEEMLDDDALAQRMGRAGRRRVEEHYELNHCVNQIVDALRQALHEPAPG